MLAMFQKADYVIDKGECGKVRFVTLRLTPKINSLDIL